PSSRLPAPERLQSSSPKRDVSGWSLRLGCCWDFGCRDSFVIRHLSFVIFPVFIAAVSLPYKIATLLYCFNEQDKVLLLERAQEPNFGCWSPCGGKLKTEIGESPYVCACREAEEEIGLKIQPDDLHLTGLISAHGSLGNA